MSFEPTIIRFPPELKIRIRGLYTCADMNVVLDAMEACADLASYPLEKIVGLYPKKEKNFYHKHIKSAKYLKIYGCGEQVDWAQVYINLENQKIHNCLSHRDITTTECNELIKKWIVDEKPVGTCLSFSIDHKYHLPSYYERIYC
ncbi:hypothetical protein GCK72_004157 [Caenorhabditis remanei]|uniref:F-box associated domain-containing protein n=1 Tax=Caenorhabditis remanei TaxID=31234 RepID=A0A6A5H8Q3_CAERE|nr:hypothetical protein GCK72_004157 [Caenorhabditis remanei]KAF1764210.1 hypothetical protein GCK72_004157 [Caenorhabditis remanei]